MPNPPTTPLAHPSYHARLHRRDVLRLAGFGGAAWLAGVAPRLAGAESTAARREPARSIILLWLAGGPSQLETFDPHPGAKIGGGTRAIETRAAGVQLAEGLERLAEQMNDVSLIRNLRSREGDHERGFYHAKTGYRMNPTLTHPAIGAVVCHTPGLPGAPGMDIPRHVSIVPSGAGAYAAGWGGYLGTAHDAFQLGDPAGRLPDMASRVGDERQRRRLAGLEVVEQAFARGRQQQAARTGHAEMMARARRMMTSDQLAAFDVSGEPAGLRARYGDTPFGRGCLAARRLIEAGVRCAEVTLSGWDAHIDNRGVHARLLATLDPAMATLIADLRDRDLLRSTVVVCGGEFGRTPQINRLDGRDHWPHNFSWALAGGGIAGGRVVGGSDSAGKRPPADAPHTTVADAHATVLTALGIDPAEEVYAPSNRPMKLSEGAAIQQLLA
ncbi:MAG: DUF1501 domain-containing protein [Planctomycetota bacterium]